MNWPQLKTILWLRWRLTRRQWVRSGGVGGVIAAVVAVLALVMCAGGFSGGLLAGIFMGDSEPLLVMAAWAGLTIAFVFMWLLGLITDLQRSETIDIPRLLHLPVLLGQIFVINYAASHLAISVVLAVPAMIGLAIGLAISRGAAMLLMLPLAIAMVLMITAWTYYLRGWLATLMTNPRRRRAVIMGITASIIFMTQLPNLYFSLFQDRDRPSSQTRKETREERRARQKWTEEEIDRAVRAQIAIPPLWVSLGAKGLAEGRALPALLGTIGLLGIGTLGLRRAFRSTLRFYQGETGGKASARARPAGSTASPARAAPVRAPARDSSRFLERQLPYVPDQAAAIALATFRSMLRAPEMKMQWGLSFFVTLFVGGSVLFRQSASIPDAAKPFVVTGVAVFSIFMLVAFVANQFGFDRDGFRAFVLSPTERRQILIGKNLAALPVAVSSAGVLITVVTIWLRLSPVVFVAALLQLLSGLLIAGMAGNVISILFPYRIQPGTMKPTKMPALAMLVLIVTQMALPLALFPSFLGPLAGFLSARAGGPPAALVNLGLSAAIALIAVGAYKATIDPLGRLLLKREMKILETVSAEVE